MNKTVAFPLWVKAQIIAKKFPLRFWGGLSIALSGGIGFMSMAFMLSLPKNPQCPQWLLPLTSASTRFYCAQAAAEQRTPEGILAAIAFLRGLPPSHRRSPESRQQMERLGMDLLTIAERYFAFGQLEKAINTLEQIPEDLRAYQLIENRLREWQERWEMESAWHSDMENQLRESRWNSALIRVSGNLNITGFVKNEYRASP